MKSTKAFRRFRNVAVAEGISFLLLLLIAMPLKYLAHFPLAVKIMGGIHGVLFIAFVVLAWEVKGEYKKTIGWFGKGLLASVLPFGTIVMDKQWKKEENLLAINS
jgi:integral membrane protein